MVQIAQASTPTEIENTRELIREYTNWALASDGSVGAPTFDGLEHELATLPGAFAPPRCSTVTAR